MRAYGKIILIGEHSVVYGHKAVAIPFTEGYIDTNISPSDQWTIDSALYQGLLTDCPISLQAVKQLLIQLEDDLSLSPVTVTITSTLPVSAGLGSSAAVATSVVKTVYAYLNKELPQDTLYEYVQFSERIAHGVSSGLDTQIITTNKPYIFTKDGYKKPLSLSLEGFLVIANSNEVGLTKDAVKIVKNSVKNHNGMQNINNIGKLTEEFITKIQENAVEELGQIMDLSEKNLSELGIETKILKELIQDAKQSGALGAKLTGSGLGGCVIALADSKEIAQKIQSIWEKKQCQTWIMDMKEVM